MVTQLVWVMTYNEELPLIKLNLQSRDLEVMWKMKFSLSTCPRSNKARYVHNRLNMWSHEITRQIKNIPPSSQCLWSPNLSLTQKFPWTLNKVVSWDHYTCTYRRPMDIKLGKVLAYRERLPTLRKELHGPLITWQSDNLEN